MAGSEVARVETGDAHGEWSIIHNEVLALWAANVYQAVMSTAAGTTGYQQPSQDWLDALDRGRADCAAGRIVDLADVLADIEADIATMEKRDLEQQVDPAQTR